MAFTEIDNPELYFQVKLYTGNGSGGHAITFDGSEDMQPNFVWIKTRSNSSNHQIHTTLSAETYYYIRPNANLAQITSNSDALTAFNNEVSALSQTLSSPTLKSGRSEYFNITFLNPKSL